nr:MAG TPA: hypothetical protein [Inoviridae sp.]
MPLLLHKKCNNCRNVVKLNHLSFVCINRPAKNCAKATYFHEQKNYW